MTVRPATRVVLIAAVAALMAGIGAARLPVWAGAEPDRDAAAAETPPDLVDAVRNDLGLTEEQARARLARQAAAVRTAQTLRQSMPDQLAGVWINTDSGNLSVAVTDRAAADKAIRAGAEARVVSRGRPDLDRILAEVERLADRDNPAGVNGWGIDDGRNGVVIAVSTGSGDAATRRFLASARALGDAVSVVEEAAGMKQEGGTVRGGETWVTARGGTCSIGFSATHRTRGTRHFVTAGHCTDELNQPVFGRDRNQIGRSSASTNNRAGDFGMVDVLARNRNRPATDWTLTSQVSRFNGTSVRVTGFTDPVPGMVVCRSGRTTGRKCGTVTAVNQTIRYDNGTVVGGLFRTNACSAPGDSGGPYVAGSLAVGIHSGGGGGCGSSRGSSTNAQPIREVLDTFQMSLVTGNRTA